MQRRLINAVLIVMVAVAVLLAPLGSTSVNDVSGPGGLAHAQPSLPAFPTGWPTTLQLGRADQPGGAATMKGQAPFGFRYQYLAAGVNTGNGWATWNPDGQFATYYIEESIANGMTPVFTYYMIYQSLPGGSGEQSAVSTNLNTNATMQAYHADLKLFFQRAGAFPNTSVILHVEPDMWGYGQKLSSGDNAASVPVKVGSTGATEWSGLPDTMAGLAQGIVKLRDQYAPNVLLAYHVSVWGTDVDISLSDPPDSEVDLLGNRAAAFYTSLGANFDLAFGEYSDRDAEFKIAQYGQTAQQAWWTADDFRRFARFITRFVNGTGKRMVLWQIPFGNTRMRAMNNTWNHYQDNRVEWLLDEPARTHLTEYVNAGVIGFLFGRGADGATNAGDANGDGITNPAPINGNTTSSLTADDDGGFFHNRAAAYYTAGAMSLNGGSTTPPPAGTPTPTSGPVQSGYTTSATVSPASVSPGGTTTVTASVTISSASTVLVDVEVHDQGGAKIHQQWFESQAFTAGQQRSYPVTWNVPAGTALGTYTVKIGIFAPNWGTTHNWNDNAASISVAAGGAPTATPSPTPTQVTGDCAPRPPVEIDTTPNGGALRVDVTATGQNNRLLALQFSQTTNAVIDVGGQTGRAGAFTVTLPGTSPTTTFTVRRARTGAATVTLTVVDRCGNWQTLVGGGPAAGF